MSTRTRGVARKLLSTLTAIVYSAELMSGCGLVADDKARMTSGIDQPLTVPTDYRLQPTEQVAPGVAVGETEFSHSVSADGAAQLTIPLWVSPGRLGLQPALALSYSSRGGNGPLGVGWELSGLSAITRCRRSPAVDGTFGGAYPEAFCLDGMRLVQTASTQTTFEYRTEVESFRKIVAHRLSSSEEPASFDVYEPEGLIRRYGSRATDARSILGGRPQTCTWIGNAVNGVLGETSNCVSGAEAGRIWMMDSVVDRFANEMQIDYLNPPQAPMAPPEPHRMLPSEIRYGLRTGAAANSGLRRVQFEYEARADSRTLSLAGVPFVADRRLRRIDIKGPLGLSDSTYAMLGSGTLKTYALAYRAQAITRQSILDRVTECTGESPAVCKPPLQFSYTEPVHEYDDTLAIPASVLPTGGASAFIQTADVDGDGLDDVVHKNANSGRWVYRRRGSGAQFTSEIDPGWGFAQHDPGLFPLTLVNFNRDQAVDALVPDRNGAATIFKVFAGRESGTFDQQLASSSVIGFTSDLRGSMMVGDVTGDLYPEIVGTECVGVWCRRAFARNSSGTTTIDFEPRQYMTSLTEHVITEPLYLDGSLWSHLDDPGWIVDVDGNGVADLITAEKAGFSDVFRQTVRPLGQGIALVAASPFGFKVGSRNLATWNSGLPSLAVPRVFLDINGDGLADSVHVDGTTLKVAMNVGGSFGRAVPMQLMSGAHLVLGLPNEMRIGDFNDDGLEDIYLVSVDVVLLGNGRSGFTETRLGIPVGIDSAAGQVDDTRRRWEQTLDFNGDGLLDYLNREADGIHVRVRRGPAPGLLTDVTGGPQTPAVRFGYKSVRDVHTPGACTYPQFCLRKGMWVVSDVGVQADVPTTEPRKFNRQLFRYVGGRFDLRGRGWLGFAEREMTEEQTGMTTRTFYDNVPRVQTTTDPMIRSELYPGAMRPLKEEQEADDRPDANGDFERRRTTTHYVYSDTLVDGRIRSHLVEVRVTEATARVMNATAVGTLVGTYVPLKSSRFSYTYGLLGLMTFEGTESFEGGFDGNGQIPSSARVKRLSVERTPSVPDTTEWLIRRFDRVTQTAVEPATPTRPQQSVTRTTDFEWQTGTASIERVRVEPGAADPDTRVDTHFSRFVDGNIQSIEETSGGSTRRVSLLWDTLDSTFPYRTTNTLGHVSTTYFHAGVGRLAVADDANNLRTQVQMDWLGRPRSLDAPSSADLTFRYGLSAAGLMILTTEAAAGGLQRQFIDRWGRTTLTQVSRMDGDLASVTRRYTRLNLLAAATFPFYGSAINGVPHEVTFNYDGMLRLKERQSPGGETESWAYDGLTVKHTDARGVVASTETDGAGRVIRSSAFAGQRAVSTAYEYGPFDVLRATVDPLGNRVEREYDVRGRQTRLVDVDTGTSRQLYNGFGELRRAEDAVGSVVELIRDGLGRVRSRVGSSGSGTETDTITWDTAPRGTSGAWLGKVHVAGNSNVSTTLGYDAFGNERLQDWEVKREHFTLLTRWDRFDRPEVLTYPAAAGATPFSVTYSYKPDGTMYKLMDDSGASLWSLRAQDASGVALSEQFGTSITTNRTLDLQKRLKRVMTYSGSSPAAGQALASNVGQYLLYDYFAGGLLKSRHDAVAKTSEDFEYDFTNRLSKWIVYQNCTKSEMDYGYDDIGNLTSRTVISGFGRSVTNTYGPTPTSPTAGPHALTTSNETGGSNLSFSYDRAGRQESSTEPAQASTRSARWDHADLPTRMSSSAGTVDFVYDAMHKRTVKQASTGDATVYIGELYERRTRGGSVAHRFKLVAGGRLIGELEQVARGAIQLAYFHPDSLGTPETTSVLSGGAGPARIEKAKHEPFGQRRFPANLAFPVSVASTRNNGFTGHEADDEFGLINMRGRMYDSRAGRFLTADPLVQAPLFAESLNRYSYVFNNPINLVDPSGFACEGVPNCIDSGAGGSRNPGGGGPNLGHSQAFDPNKFFDEVGKGLRDLFRGGGGGGGGGSAPAKDGTRASAQGGQGGTRSGDPAPRPSTPRNPRALVPELPNFEFFPEDEPRTEKIKNIVLGALEDKTVGPALRQMGKRKDRTVRLINLAGEKSGGETSPNCGGVDCRLLKSKEAQETAFTGVDIEIGDEGPSLGVVPGRFFSLKSIIYHELGHAFDLFEIGRATTNDTETSKNYRRALEFENRARIAPRGYYPLAPAHYEPGWPEYFEFP